MKMNESKWAFITFAETGRICNRLHCLRRSIDAHDSAQTESEKEIGESEDKMTANQISMFDSIRSQTTVLRHQVKRTT